MCCTKRKLHKIAIKFVMLYRLGNEHKGTTIQNVSVTRMRTLRLMSVDILRDGIRIKI